MNGYGLVALALATAVISAALTYAAARVARSRGLMDIPNDRSSHRIPTPRGGGIAVVISATIAFVVLFEQGRIGGHLLLALLGGTMVAGVGHLDDRREVPASVRLVVHVVAAVWALAWLGGLPALRLGDHLVSLGALGHVLGVLVIVWTLNLFNFMDGIDGIAGAEALFISWSAALLQLLTGGPDASAMAAVPFGAACAGFLVWNWQPARIFLGDIGSGFLGYVIAVLAIAGGDARPVGFWTWLILGGVFFADATVTLVRRLLRGERVHQPHRSHAYQWLARRWSSHARTVMAVMAVNMLWLLPCAWLATRSPGYSPWVAAIALPPVAALAVSAGAGRAEHRKR